MDKDKVLFFYNHIKDTLEKNYDDLKYIAKSYLLSIQTEVGLVWDSDYIDEVKEEFKILRDDLYSKIEDQKNKRLD